MKNFCEKKQRKKSSTIVCHDPCMYFWSPKDFSCVLIFYCNVLNWWAFYTLLLSIAPKNSILWPPRRKVFWYQICSPVSSFFYKKCKQFRFFPQFLPQSIKDLYMIKRFKKHLVPNIIILYLYEYLWHFHIKNPFKLIFSFQHKYFIETCQII